MRDQGYFITGDLREAMRQEAREENRAEAEAAWYDAVAEVEDIDELEDMRRDLADEQHDIAAEIQDLRRKISELESKQERVTSRKKFVERQLHDLDPEVVVEITGHETSRYGWQTSITIEKCPPLTGRTNDDDGPTLINRPVTATVADAVTAITEDIDASEYGDNTTIATIRFDNMEDDDPTVEWHVTGS